jgi:hypothetical protein
LTKNAPRASLPARTAGARREVTYWAGRSRRTALRAAGHRLENATGWSVTGWPVFMAGLVIMLRSCPLWDPHPGKSVITGGIYAAAGIIMFYLHGEAKGRRGRG